MALFALVAVLRSSLRPGVQVAVHNMGTAAMRSEALHVTSISYELGGTPQILVSPENVDQQTVGRLERNFEHAMVEILVNLGLKKLPLLPSPKTLHLMAKAAVTVYEAAVENQGCDD